ncbi:hypothetical protein EDB80DRAFT_708584 [Ilyonectria destructans]|nr:hypothetical protein EDB80DRAFT_708584 [Ilyonectria destructans]
MPDKPPTPPPLPSKLGHRHNCEEQSLSPYLEKPASVPCDGHWHPIEATKSTVHDREPIYYFFYGTLMCPVILKGVLDTDADPELREAKVVNYPLASCGQYRALINGEPGEEVLGCAVEVQSPEYEFKLAYYEGNAYKLAPCLIHFGDGKEPPKARLLCRPGIPTL